MPKATNYPSVPLANASLFPTWQTAAGNHPLFPIACQQQSSRWQTVSQSYSGSNVFGRTHMRAGLSLPVQRWPFVTQSLILDPYLPDRGFGPGSNLTPSQLPEREDSQADGSLPAVDCVSGKVISVVLFPRPISHQQACAPLAYLLSLGPKAKREAWLYKRRWGALQLQTKSQSGWISGAASWFILMFHLPQLHLGSLIKNQIFAAEYVAACPRNPIAFELFVIYLCCNCESWWQDSEMLKNVMLNRNLSS